MNIQPSIDLKKVNLQTAVGYLVSLHENEYQWNLLGIRVVGVAATEADIPEGTYEYGDAYEVGTEPPYDLYIYTRPDGKVHTEGYWFPVGKFPMPGPQGPKGDGIETFTNLSLTHDIHSGDVYGSDNGQLYNGTSTIQYKDSTTGETKSQEIYTTVFLPIVGSDYINIDGDATNNRFVVRLDDTALALDYIKIDKTNSNYVPWWNNGVIKKLGVSQNADGGFLALRLPDGQLRMTECMSDSFSTASGNNKIDFYALYNNTVNTEYSIDKTSTDTGTLTTAQLAQLYGTVQANNRHIIYDGQCYVRMDPTNAPGGTLNYIHLDSIDDGSGGYKATGKCFSITISTREWKVVDLNFGGQTTHNLLITDNVSGNGYYFQLATNQSAAYTTADARTIQAEVKGKIIPCVFRKGRDSDKKFYSGILQASDAGFSCYYGEQNMDFGMTPTQVTVKDNV